ncbi:MAG: EscU/YscU/HrcU family type III secretion system export apparatus switch protein [Oscillospiraceae bacterium]|nr:EscU/YscU/HrcU family type III secretion system export apparatus switch protein [Oscillospiraceae bacterium]
MANGENKKFQAAALSYDPGENDVPILSAFGEGRVAEKIVEVARESGVPVIPEPGLTGLLSRLSVGDEIAPEMYDAVAKVLAFVSEMDRTYGEKVRRGMGT